MFQSYDHVVIVAVCGAKRCVCVCVCALCRNETETGLAVQLILCVNDRMCVCVCVCVCVCANETIQSPSINTVINHDYMLSKLQTTQLF